MTGDVTPLIANCAYRVQALIAVMWRKGRWACPRANVSTLQSQLGASSVDIDKWYEDEDHLQLALKVNLLSNALPLLRKLEAANGPDESLMIEIRAILDMICDVLVTSDAVREWLRGHGGVHMSFPSVC
jgi:hypothetical protein